MKKNQLKKTKIVVPLLIILILVMPTPTLLASEETTQEEHTNDSDDFSTNQSSNSILPHNIFDDGEVDGPEIPSVIPGDVYIMAGGRFDGVVKYLGQGWFPDETITWTHGGGYVGSITTTSGEEINTAVIETGTYSTEELMAILSSDYGLPIGVNLFEWLLSFINTDLGRGLLERLNQGDGVVYAHDVADKLPNSENSEASSIMFLRVNTDAHYRERAVIYLKEKAANIEGGSIHKYDYWSIIPYENEAGSIAEQIGHNHKQCDEDLLYAYNGLTQSYSRNLKEYYYCTELVWAAYYSASQWTVNIDGYENPQELGSAGTGDSCVWPHDIYNSPHTTPVYWGGTNNEGGWSSYSLEDVMGQTVENPWTYLITGSDELSGSAEDPFDPNMN